MLTKEYLNYRHLCIGSIGPRLCDQKKDLLNSQDFTTKITNIAVSVDWSIGQISFV